MLDMVENIKHFFENNTNDNLFIVTANPEIVVYASEHVTYRKLINSASYIIADGTGVVKASNRLKQPLKRRVPGIELMEECINLTRAKSKGILVRSKMKLLRKHINYNRNILMLLLSIIMGILICQMKL